MGVRRGEPESPRNLINVQTIAEDAQRRAEAKVNWLLLGGFWFYSRGITHALVATERLGSGAPDH
jgi:hypothetical protein